jgi:hypothetical protein
MGFWANSLRIFNAIRPNGPQSIRHLARPTGLSKRRGPRLAQARERRDTPPESWRGDTEAGRGGRRRLVGAARFLCGRKRGVGAATIRAFCSRLRLAAHVRCAPRALRGGMEVLEPAMLETAAAWEHDGGAHGERRPILGAVDDTCWERMMVVCMDLASGYLLVAEGAAERPYDPWPTLVTARLETLEAGGR